MRHGCCIATQHCIGIFVIDSRIFERKRRRARHEIQRIEASLITKIGIADDESTHGYKIVPITSTIIHEYPTVVIVKLTVRYAFIIKCFPASG
jgi:hypothetical protein